MRAQFGVLNAGLNEAVRGIEVIKATGQEAQERRKFRNQARLYRDYQVAQGVVQARYLPQLLLAVAVAGALFHGVWMLQHDQITLGTLLAYLGLMQQLGFPAFISIFSFSMVQMGLSAAARVLAVIKEETELDQNAGGYARPMRGEIAFDDVTFGYEEDEGRDRGHDLRRLPGETIAIVGETGSGKSSLTKLVNRISTSIPAACWSTASTCATGTSTRCDRTSRRSSRTSPSSRAASPRTSPSVRRRGQPRAGRAGGEGRPGHEFIVALEQVTTPSSASAA